MKLDAVESQKRINLLLDRIHPEGGTGFFIQLKRMLHAPWYNHTVFLLNWMTESAWLLLFAAPTRFSLTDNLSDKPSTIR